MKTDMMWEMARHSSPTIERTDRLRSSGVNLELLASLYLERTDRIRHEFAEVEYPIGLMRELARELARARASLYLRCTDQL